MDEFDWDEGNKEKNWLKHKVSLKECEEAFFNRPIITYRDVKHSFNEERFAVLSKTNSDRTLHIVFTIRSKKIRIISARDQNKKERIKYEKNSKNN